jgi:Zn-finger protein
MIMQIGKKKKLAHSSGGTVSVWKCYRCNLIFHEESLAFLHEDISNHSAVRVEYDYGSPRLIKESRGLVVETFTN